MHEHAPSYGLQAAAARAMGNTRVGLVCEDVAMRAAAMVLNSEMVLEYGRCCQ